MSKEEHAERIRELVTTTNLTRAQAAFVVALDAGEVESDLYEVDQDGRESFAAPGEQISFGFDIAADPIGHWPQVPRPSENPKTSAT